MAKITKKIDPFRDSGNTNDAAGKPAKIAKKFFGVPKDVRDASKRQYSGKDYTTDDKKTILNYYKKQNKKGKA